MPQPFWLGPVLLVFATLSVACIDKDMAQKAIQAVQSENRPDEMPVMQNIELPFRFPASLYARQVQGNVTLRIHIDTTGFVTAESTMVYESSGYAALDSAAVAGSERLRFTPARMRGKVVALSVTLPVFFRHPDQPPLPGDTVLVAPSPSPSSSPPTASSKP